MKTISSSLKSKRTATKRVRDKLTPTQVAKAKAMLVELDVVYGGRDAGSVDFLLSMRRGEV